MKTLKIIAVCIFCIGGLFTGICAIFGTRYATVQRGNVNE